MTATAWTPTIRTPLGWAAITTIVTGDLLNWSQSTMQWFSATPQWQYFGQTVIITGLPTPVAWNSVPR